MPGAVVSLRYNQVTRQSAWIFDRPGYSQYFWLKYETSESSNTYIESFMGNSVSHLPGSSHAKTAAGKRSSMLEPEKSKFDVEAFLTSTGLGRTLVQLKPKQILFSQGGPADSIFYLRKGRVKLTVVSHVGKEATVAIVSDGEFIGEESLQAAPRPRLRTATATAITACSALKVSRDAMVRALNEEHALSDLFLKSLLKRSIRFQADLVDQLFNSSEMRLARLLLLMADSGTPGEPKQFIPRITQETLADMIGTTRSRVSLFMNRFRKLGYIEYRGRIRVHRSLLDAMLRGELIQHDSERSTDSSTRRFPSKRG